MRLARFGDRKRAACLVWVGFVGVRLVRLGLCDSCVSCGLMYHESMSPVGVKKGGDFRRPRSPTHAASLSCSSNNFNAAAEIMSLNS